LRRGQGARLKVGQLEWSWDERALYHGDEMITLTGREASLLESLLQRPGRVVPKEALASRMSDGLDAAGDNTVEVYVHRLRRKLEAAGADDPLQTVRSWGLRLRVAPEERHQVWIGADERNHFLLAERGVPVF